MLKKLFIGLFAALLLSLSYPCYADYIVTGEELQMLDGNLAELAVLASRSEAELKQLQGRLKESEAELHEAENESARLRDRLTELQGINAKQRQSLENANAYLERYAAEEKRKRRNLKFQRNCGYAVALAAIIVAICR